MYHESIVLITRALSLFLLSFAVALALAPTLIRILYRYKCWKKKPRTETVGGAKTPIFTKLHAAKEVSTPRMGGILIWLTVLIVTAVGYLLARLFPDSSLRHLNILSRSQTYLPLATLLAGSLLGLVDDLMVISDRGKYIGGGMRFKVRLILISVIALVGAWWFYAKLGWSSLYVPFYGNIEIDGWYLVLFLVVTLATFSSGVVDGLDGLSAGVMIPIFAAYGAIAYTRGSYDLASFIVVLIGALVTYLWFNVHPAKFYMSETGMMGLSVTLAVIAFLTNAVFFLPLIGAVLVVESASVLIQLISKRVFRRKVFLSAPIHHHLEALGWPESQITMRFWIISFAASALGLVAFFLARYW
ncbi:MAG: hypothetical protein HY978_00150 [Candidatus Liptonbacteria bacterium]|nr:hypothetical protein [Candidatus Liptonbacteria bacterium]